MSARILAILLLATSAYGLVPLTGKMVDPSGAGLIPANSFVRFELRNCGANRPRILGIGDMVKTTLDFRPDANGNISGSIYGNNEIDCAGQRPTEWAVTYFYNGAPSGATKTYLITGAFDLTQATPNTVAPVVAAPTGDNTYQRLDGGSSATGNYVPAIDNTSSLGSVSLGWKTGYFSTSLLSPFFSSRTANPAASGILRMAKTDQYCWRNNANSADVCISKNTSDQIVLPGVSSSAANPASSGFARLATADQICWRNNANSNDVCVSKDGSDVIQQPSTNFTGNVNGTLISASGQVWATTLYATNGIPCSNGELGLSAGWQSTGAATVTAVQGIGQTCSWTITTGTTTGANPTVTDTLTNAFPNALVVCELNIHGGTHTPAAGEGFQQTTLSATAPIFTFNGTPTAGGTTYFVTRRCGP